MPADSINEELTSRDIEKFSSTLEDVDFAEVDSAGNLTAKITPISNAGQEASSFVF